MKLKLKEGKGFDQGHKLVNSGFQTSSNRPQAPRALCSVAGLPTLTQQRKEMPPAHWHYHSICVQREGKDQIYYFENKVLVPFQSYRHQKPGDYSSTRSPRWHQ